MCMCHCTSEVRKARLRPSSQGSRGSRGAPAKSELSLSNRIFRATKGLRTTPTAECNLKIQISLP